MDLEFIRKTRDSSTGNCPALYMAANGNYVVQGWELDEVTRADLRGLADNETAVEIPDDVIDGLYEEAGNSALYRVANGNYVVRGRVLDEATRANLRDLADNETAVEIPASIIDGLRREDD